MPLGDPHRWRKAPAAQSWSKRAACRDMPSEIWYPPRSTKSAYDEALAICGICPVRQQCLDHAISQDEKHGVWGGTTPRDRYPAEEQETEPALA